MQSQHHLSLYQRRSLALALVRRRPIHTSHNGFTLSELLMVVIIIGVLSAIALPSFMNQRDRAYLASAKAWAASEARKCAAAIAGGSAADFTAEKKPEELGSKVTVSAGSCAVGGVWSASGFGTTHTFSVGDGGSLTTGSSPTSG